MDLTYTRGDSLPAYEAEVVLSGEHPDYGTGWTFRLVIGDDLVVKTTGIWGQPDGSVLVAWNPGDLDIPPGHYRLRLTGTRSEDNRSWTIHDGIHIQRP